MSDRKLHISFGGGHQAEITSTRLISWADAVRVFTKRPAVHEDKAAPGWYSFAEFDNSYRHSDNFVARHALTFDYDHVTPKDVLHIFETYKDLEFVAYTTASHTKEKPRLRMLLPLSRPAGYDEFQAVSRKLAARAGMELASRETHVPAQFMYMPSVKTADLPFSAKHNTGAWVDVDAVLAEYTDWTDRTQWPKRREADGVHADGERLLPTEKPGIVGEFCRAFDIHAAIERFGLPYVPTSNPDRLTYTAGSRPEGAIVYDGATKLHSHHDTDPARGQNNAFDLVRLHRFAGLDTDGADLLPVTQRPSYRAMCTLALEQPELRAAVADAEFEDLGDLTEEEQRQETPEKTTEALAKRICDVLRTTTRPRWLIADYIERAVIALLVGKRGSYKSFIALDWTGRIAKNIDPASKEAVYVISAEGGDYDRRWRAWWKAFGDERPVESIPLYVVERRLNINSKEGVELIRQDCQRLGVRPVLFVLDTFSKLSGGLDENDNSAVKQFIGWLDNGLKRAFDATVLLVAHTGHSDDSRARGASALGADTDAEYIVKRDEKSGTVSLTRERFKASPELDPVTYKPESIDLEYKDDRGRPVTSLVLREVEVGDQAARPREPKGGTQKRVWDVVQEMCAGGVEARVTAVQEKVAGQMVVAEGKRDRRREVVARAMTELADQGFIYLHDDGRKVSMSRTMTVAEEEFDEDLDAHLR